jgi:hypothetical protein
VWTIEAAYVDPRWLNGQDPHYDYAFLVVAAQQQGGRPVRLNQVVTGKQSGASPRPGKPGPSDRLRQRHERQTDHMHRSYQRRRRISDVRLPRFVDGTSGSPWIDTSRSSDLTFCGLIGGPHQGGCDEYTSFSSCFDRATRALYQRAVTGAAPDGLPVPGDDAC